MTEDQLHITKSTGEMVHFSIHKLRKSLQYSGASEAMVNEILERVQDELYPGISTREIHNRAFALLKKKKSVYASKYKLKKAIYELGPTGFPFERFVAGILHFSGYEVKVGQMVQGNCVSHEIDVLASKNGTLHVIECKFHGDQSLKCDVKVPLYINSRYLDVKDVLLHQSQDTQGWLVTNTRFTGDALQYGKCAGLYLLSWDFPLEDGLKDRIDRLGLYPITVSLLLSKREKNLLLDKGVVLFRNLEKHQKQLDEIGVSKGRKDRILKEMRSLCKN
ncbi:restriction endonuclease [Flagellimonas zhangzhouensis]|uniref:ATP cone domain-containing protein n=1 Tax=Flagellimonas zhangzhouensis TaxID=1073328 RepID=A0A1H2Y9L1_9FLAO|nr:restriction endonuclease [Allomuricauda zhangzhouensis]SDQ98106.1 ATP cone domain-containing protein [Allomuricauda zhangzhouensis]SDX01730.1 ATP cone domain-containing protein [Allomuricauda zhangzhouensis]